MKKLFACLLVCLLLSAIFCGCDSNPFDYEGLDDTRWVSEDPEMYFVIDDDRESDFIQGEMNVGGTWQPFSVGMKFGSRDVWFVMPEENYTILTGHLSSPDKNTMIVKINTVYADWFDPSITRIVFVRYKAIPQSNQHNHYSL